MRATVLVAALCFFGSAKAWSDASPTPRPGVSLGGRDAYIWNQDADAEDGNFFGGAQIRIHLAKLFAVEGSADYRRERFSNGATIADIFPVQVSGLLYLLPNSPVSPFLLGGVGWYFTHVQGPGGLMRPGSIRLRGGGLQFF